MGTEFKRVFSGAVLVIAAAARPAAADFAGSYVGSHVGGNFPTFDIVGDFDNPAATAYSLKPDGWTAGVQAGYNLPIAGAVIGFEGAVSFGSEVDTRNVVAPNFGTDDDFASFVFKDTITLALRAGVPVNKVFLPFVKVGIAWADVEGQAGDTDGNPPVIDDLDVVRLNGWEHGYVVGGGLEFLWSENWSIKAEYEYQDFGSVSIINLDGDTNKIDIDNHTVKVGVSYFLN